MFNHSYIILRKDYEKAMSELQTQHYVEQTISPNKQFDQRLSSRISTQPQSPTKSRRQPNDKRLRQDLESGSCNYLLRPEFSLSKLQWLSLTKITDQIYSSSSLSENGDPQLLAISDEYIAVVTSKCYALLFSFQQVLLLKVKWANITPSTRITALALSIDSTYLAMGNSDGAINLYDLKKADPIITITPTTAHELQFDGSHHHIAHLKGSAIRFISFIGSRHTGFVSSDDTGITIFHNGGRSLTGYSCRSKIVFGRYDLANIMTGKVNYSNTVLDFHLLPIGSKKSLADEMSLISMITPHSMVVLSLNSELKTHIKMKKPKISDQSLGMSGCVSWFPATVGDFGRHENSPMLAYAWSNILGVLEIKAENNTNQEGEQTAILNVTSKKETKYSETIVCLRWLNYRVLVALTRSQKLIFYDSSSLVILKEVDLMYKQMKSIPIFPHNSIGLIQKSFFGSFFTLKSSIFIFQHREIAVANMSNWADVLLNLLEKGKYIEALKESKRQYQGGEDNPLLNLPDDDEARHSIMKEYLIQIFRSSLKYIFTEQSSSDNSLDRYREITLLLIQTCLTINAPSEMYDLIYEKLLDYRLDSVFFQVLENFVFSSEIVTFSPTILKAMVVHYIEEKDTNTLERLICLLDIQQLDIDLTVTLCKQYHLNETLAYIWTTLLHDIFTPLIEAVLRIKNFNEKENVLSGAEKEEIVNDIGYVYPYISYTLTGRQYPTDKLFPYTYSLSAKLNVYYFLFNGSTISWPLGSAKIHTVDDYKAEPAFPYLSLLLKYDSESMLSCLNEAFEDDLLNDNEMVGSGSTIDDKYQLRVSRQYIIDVLLGVFHDNDSSFSLADNIRLAVFITRNYPKYLQFIRIADSISDEMIAILCKAGTSKKNINITTELVQDCELGLQSLLSVYKPLDIDYVLLQVKKAGFYQVLLYLYQSEERYMDVLELWVDLQNMKKIEPEKTGNIELFKPISEILKDAMKASKGSNRAEIVQILSSNFELFVKSDPKSLASVVCEFCPELNSDVVNFEDNHIKFDYLREIFNTRDEGGGKKNKLLGAGLRYEYLKSLISQRRMNVSDISQSDAVLQAQIYDDPISEKSFMDDRIEHFVLSLDNLSTDIVDLLKSDESNEFEVLIKWYVVKYQYGNAIDSVCEILERSSNEMELKGYSKQQETKVWRCINKVFSVLSTKDPTLTKKLEDSLALRETLLLQIIEASVSILTKLTNASSKESKVEHKVVDTFKRVVQSIFTYVINVSSEDSSSFNKIFKKFLDDSAIHQTKLGDVKMVLREIFISFCNDQQILTIIQILVDNDIFDNLMVLESLKIQGWSPKNIECEACGRKIWGGKIGNSVYESWRDHKLKNFRSEKINENNEGISQIDKLNELYVFQCRHTYHRKCLENMGMIKDRDKECILCRQN